MKSQLYIGVIFFIMLEKSAGFWFSNSQIEEDKSKRDIANYMPFQPGINPLEKNDNYVAATADRTGYGGGGGGGGYEASYSPGMSALALLGFLFFLNMISQTMMMPMNGGKKKRDTGNYLSVLQQMDESKLMSILNTNKYCQKWLVCEIQNKIDNLSTGPLHSRLFAQLMRYGVDMMIGNDSPVHKFEPHYYKSGKKNKCEILHPGCSKLRQFIG